MCLGYFHNIRFHAICCLTPGFFAIYEFQYKTFVTFADKNGSACAYPPEGNFLLSLLENSFSVHDLVEFLLCVLFGMNGNL